MLKSYVVNLTTQYRGGSASTAPIYDTKTVLANEEIQKKINEIIQQENFDLVSFEMNQAKIIIIGRINGAQNA